MKILIILLLLLGFLVYPASADTWVEDTNIVSGLQDIGFCSTPTIFNDSGTWKLITGTSNGNFFGFEWNGTGWNSNTSLVTGIGSVGWDSSPDVFYKDDTWYLITGGGDGSFYGYKWTGSVWQADASIVNGLGNIGWGSSPDIFYKNDTWYLIAGEQDGVYNGFNWTGTAWQSDPAIASGLGDVGFYSRPTTFHNNDTWYLITGERDSNLHGFNWTGTTWQSDSTIISGLEDWALYGIASTWSKPEIFNYMGTFNLILGEGTGNFYGFEGPLYISPEPDPEPEPEEEIITPVIIAINNFISPPPASSPAVHAIKEKITIQSIVTNIFTYISTSSNWIVLIFAYIGAVLGVLLLKSESIVMNTLLGGTITWIAVLAVNFSAFSLIHGTPLDAVMFGIVGMIIGIVITHFTGE